MAPALLVLIAIAAVGLLLAGWTLLVWRIYRLKRPSPVPVEVVAQDGWRLTFYRRSPAVRRFEEPVLLCHGLAANHRNMDFEPPNSLAMYLADAGFECFSVDWRGTLASRGAPRKKRATDYSVDDHIRLDAPAFLQAALELSGARRAFWVGHSLGGLIGYAVAQGEAAPKLAGVISIGSPAFFQYAPWMRLVVSWAKRLAWPRAIRQRWFSVVTAPFLGHVTLPLTEVVMNPHHIPARLQRKVYAQVVSSISRRVLAQFEDWLTHDRFTSADGRVDYRAGLAQLQVPLLITAGSSDYLAPPAAVTRAYEAAGSVDKTLMVFGRDNGDALDYGHGDLIFGSGAPLEVFPRLGAWLQGRATPWQGYGADASTSGSNTEGESQRATQGEPTPAAELARSRDR